MTRNKIDQSIEKLRRKIRHAIGLHNPTRKNAKNQPDENYFTMIPIWQLVADEEQKCRNNTRSTKAKLKEE